MRLAGHIIIAGCVLSLCGKACAAAAAPAAVPTYDLEISLDPSTKHMDVKGRISIPAGVVGDPRRLTLSNQMEHVSIAVVSDGSLTPVAQGPNDPDHPEDRIYLLPPNSRPGAPVQIQVAYDSTDTTGFVFSLQGPTLFADGSDTVWYPIIGSESRGFGALRFKTPDGLTVVASGSNADDDARTFLSTKPIHFSFVAGNFVRTHADGAIPVDIYTLKPRTDLQDYARRVQATLEILTQAFGPFPRDSFSVVEVPTEQASKAQFGGVSSAGAILMNTSSFDGGFSLPFFAHEIGHQWWGNLVTNRGPAGNAMLGEAMAQWGALYAVGKIEGPAAAARFRRTGYPGYIPSQSAEGYFNIAGAGLDHSLSRLPSGPVGHELSNSKGFLVYSLLAETVGPDKFTDALKTLTRDFGGQDLPWPTFLQRLQDSTGRDLSTFIDQWFDRPGAPEFTPRWRQAGHTVDLTIRQTAPFYTVGIEVRLQGAHGESKTAAILAAGAETRATVTDVPFTATSIEIDPDYHVLHWTPKFRSEASALGKVIAADFAPSCKEKAAGYSAALDDIDGRPDVWGVGFRAEEGLAKCAMNAGDWIGEKQHLLAALAKPGKPADEVPIIFYLLAISAQHLQDADLLKRAKAGAASADAVLTHPTGAGRAAEALSIQ